MRTVIASEAAPLLDAWANALGGRARLARVLVVHQTGRLSMGGLSGRFDTWASARGERREEDQLATVDRSVDVFDGEHGWRVDRNRQARTIDGPELADQVALAYLVSNAALLPDHMAGRVTRDGDRLILQPDGGRPLTVAFDPATHLPTQISRPDAEKTRVLTLSDWRDVDGVRFPFVIIDDDGDPRDARTLRVDAVELDHPPPPAAFAPPTDAPHDVRFAVGQTTSLPIELTASLVFVQVGVNGSAPLAFILDTGAEVTVINRSRLARLGLTAVGDLAVGAGGGDVAMSYVKGVTFALPGVTLGDQTVTAIPLDSLEEPLGHPIDGILGYDFLSRFVVEVDYEHKRLRLTDPAGFRYTGRGEALPITLDGAVPSVRATIELPGRAPLPAWFVVDTGCTCEISFNAPFTQANHLLDAVPRKLVPPKGSSRGAGGETTEIMGRVGAIRLGGTTLKAPTASFATDTTGAMADPESAGLVGGVIWRRFVVTFDYSKKTMWIEKNGRFDEPSRAVGAGILWSEGEGGPGFLVHDLVAGTPGAEAGLAPGDVLVSVDGKPAAELTMDALDSLFHEEGVHRTVVVERAGKTVTVTITPRDLF